MKSRNYLVKTTVLSLAGKVVNIRTIVVLVIVIIVKM